MIGGGAGSVGTGSVHYTSSPSPSMSMSDFSHYLLSPDGTPPVTHHSSMSELKVPINNNNNLAGTCHSVGSLKHESSLTRNVKAKELLNNDNNNNNNIGNTMSKHSTLHGSNIITPVKINKKQQQSLLLNNTNTNNNNNNNNIIMAGDGMNHPYPPPLPTIFSGRMAGFLKNQNSVLSILGEGKEHQTNSDNGSEEAVVKPGYNKRQSIDISNNDSHKINNDIDDIIAAVVDDNVNNNKNNNNNNNSKQQQQQQPQHPRHPNVKIHKPSQISNTMSNDEFLQLTEPPTPPIQLTESRTSFGNWLFLFFLFFVFFCLYFVRFRKVLMCVCVFLFVSLVLCS